MKTKPSCSDYLLYLVTDPLLNKGYPVLAQIELALKGGVKIIQIREKKMPVPEFIRLASEALRLTREQNAFLIINDSVEVALAAGADGLHVGQDDMPVKQARKMLGEDAILGVSVKTVEEAIEAEKGGADYIAVSGIFPTNTKQDVGYLPGLEGLRDIKKRTSLPVVGIGGINIQNCRSVMEAGADGIAVVTAITMSDNIPETCRRFLSILNL